MRSRRQLALPVTEGHDVLLDLHSTRRPRTCDAVNNSTIEPSPNPTGKGRRQRLALFVEGWLDTYAKGVER
jgi:hypothetical protein